MPITLCVESVVSIPVPHDIVNVIDFICLDRNPNDSPLYHSETEFLCKGIWHAKINCSSTYLWRYYIEKQEATWLTYI